MYINLYRFPKRFEEKLMMTLLNKKHKEKKRKRISSQNDRGFIDYFIFQDRNTSMNM